MKRAAPMATALRRICLTADDFGLHAGIDAAILELAESRRIQALSCMMGGQSWRSSAPRLRGHSSLDAELGLHLDLTERPLERAPRPLRTLILDAYSLRLDRRSVRAEIRLQLNAFEAALGRAPDYVDGHQHVHQLPGVRSELLEELAARYPANAQPWLRSTIPGKSAPDDGSVVRPPAPPLSTRLKAAFIASLGGYALRGEAQQQGWRMNAALTGVYSFDADAPTYRSLLASWLAHAADGSILMCHPSRSNQPGDAIGPARLIEYQVLASSELPLLISELGLQTQAMRDILGGGRPAPLAQPLTDDDLDGERRANPH